MENVEKDTLTSRPCGLCRKTIWEGNGFLGVDPETICKCGVEHRSNVEAMISEATRRGYEKGLLDVEDILDDESDESIKKYQITTTEDLTFTSVDELKRRLQALKSSKV